MKRNRIPPKGTPEYRRYWRDKRVIQEIGRVLEEVRHCSENTDIERKQKYMRSMGLILEAKQEFNEGWRITL